MTAPWRWPSQWRSATAGVKSEKPPVHLGNPATGWPVRPSQACSVAESVARITSGTPSPETSARAGALMKARPWISCENRDRLCPIDGSHTPTPECTWIPMPGVSTTPVTTSEAEDPDCAIWGTLGDEVLRGAVALYEALHVRHRGQERAAITRPRARGSHLPRYLPERARASTSKVAGLNLIRP